jgi:predicted MFS family arabinose efflux permease
MLAISLLMLGLVEGGKSLQSLLTVESLLLFAAGAALLGLFVWVELRAPDPIIPFTLFRNRMVSVSVAAGFLAGIAMFGAISFIPLFAQGALGMSATEAGSLLTPLMLSWVTMSVIGGRLLLRVSFRPVTMAGFIIMAVGFVLISRFNRESASFWLYVDLGLIGAGLGFTMLTLLIAVQQAVERTQLGVATSLNQFSRAIGGAFGVAVMGVALTIGMTTQLSKVAELPNSPFSKEQAEEFASNPNALIEPHARAGLPQETLAVLQDAMAAAVHPVFWVGAAVSILALFVVLFMPSHRADKDDECLEEDCGEKMIMAEQTVINARNQPVAD